MNKENFKEFKRDLKKYKKNLMKKAKDKGLYENFGEREINLLNDKYSLYCINLYEDYGKEINKLYTEFKDFCYNCDDNTIKRYFEK